MEEIYRHAGSNRRNHSLQMGEVGETVQAFGRVSGRKNPGAGSRRVSWAAAQMQKI